MPGLRKGIELPIIPEDFIIARKKPRPKEQTDSSIFVKQGPRKMTGDPVGSAPPGKRETFMVNPQEEPDLNLT